MRSQQHSVLLRGESVHTVLPALLPLLNGGRTLDELVELLPEIEPHVVVEAIAFLAQQNLLEDAAAEAPPALAAHSDRYFAQTTFWLSISNDRFALQRKLAESTVLVYDVGPVGSAIAMSLALAGVGHLLLVDSEAVTFSDLAAGPWYPCEALGQNRADVLRHRLSLANEQVGCDTIQVRPSTSGEVSAIVRDCSLSVVCGAATSVYAFQMFNDGCLEAGKEWLRVALDHQSGVIGPLVVPRQSSCFTCLRLRQLSNSTPVQEAVAADRHFLAAPEEAVGDPILGGFAAAVANLAVVEILKTLTGFAYPITTGAYLSLNLFTMELSRHEVLKLPRCPTCGPFRNRPATKIWDIESRGN